uniref:Ig-like domain-containing protein n=1 Tax=Astyanax mexicanus TaxID=7994 RepID=A0A8B9GPX1_ASTMX
EFNVLLHPFNRSSAAYTDINQQDHLKISEVGGSVNLSCVTSKASRDVTAWMKQKLGEKPLLIATSYQRQPATFYNDFDKGGRFKMLIAADIFNLSISNIEPSDSATYYCASVFIYKISFGNGTYLLVKGMTNIQPFSFNTVYSWTEHRLSKVKPPQVCSFPAKLGLFENQVAGENSKLASVHFFVLLLEMTAADKKIIKNNKKLKMWVLPWMLHENGGQTCRSPD